MDHGAEGQGIRFDGVKNQQETEGIVLNYI